jgi:hypothetical protein
MQSATRGIFFILAFILFLFGIMDVAELLKLGEEIHWRFPIILIGLGAGIPIALFVYPDTFSDELSNQTWQARQPTVVACRCTRR